MACPWQTGCAARRSGDPQAFPVKAAKYDKPLRRGAAFVAMRPDGAILLRRRPDHGLLAGMSEVPCSPWSTDFKPGSWNKYRPIDARWTAEREAVRHTFTHFHLHLDVFRAATTQDFQPPEGWWWSTREALADEALPTVMRKVIKLARAPRPDSSGDE